MKEFSELVHHPISEKLTEILRKKTQSTSPLFFRVLVSYYFAKVAATMRASIATHDRGCIPINQYVMNLAPSGHGKGFSASIMEEQVLYQFRQVFMNVTFPKLAEQHLASLATDRAIRNGTDNDAEMAGLMKEFTDCGTLLFNFDSATPAAVKQMRHKLLLSNAGAINLEIDEVGSNLLGQMDAMNTFLELYDVGLIKPKLVKNTNENKRTEEINGRTPTNMLLFGTPAKLMDGGKTEDEFYSLLETGYARRLLFGYSRDNPRVLDKTAEEIYDDLVDTSLAKELAMIASRISDLADPSHYNKQIQISREVSILLIEYKLHCERRAAGMNEHEETRRSELAHRYTKALKQAGAYAFIDGDHEITEDHLYQAIKLVEESGEAFSELLARDRPYVKLAKYLGEIEKEVTHADLTEDLPFYPKAANQRSDMLSLAIAWGYKNNVIIKKQFNDGIEFLEGEALRYTDLNKMVVSYSQHVAYHYLNETPGWNDMHRLVQAQGIHWTNHHFSEGHRTDEKALAGFNMVVIDVDGGCSLDTAKLLLRDYRALYYTTKRHTQQENRFRILLPTSHFLKLNSDDFKEFMQGVFDWLPFKVDADTGQRNKKWLSHAGHHEYTEGKLLDVLPFIPKTAKAEERQKQVMDTQSLSNLERWFVQNTGKGNRSNQLIKYAFILVDTGMDMAEIRQAVVELNNKLAQKIPEAEIDGTIMVTVGRAIHNRNKTAATP